MLRGEWHTRSKACLGCLGFFKKTSKLWDLETKTRYTDAFKSGKPKIIYKEDTERLKSNKLSASHKF